VPHWQGCHMGSMFNLHRAVNSCYELLFVVSPKPLDTGFVVDHPPIYITCHLLTIGYPAHFKVIIVYCILNKGRIRNYGVV